MKLRTYAISGKLLKQRIGLNRVFSVLTLLAMIFGPLAPATVAPAIAAPVAASAPLAAPSTCGTGDPLFVTGTCAVTIDVHDFASGAALENFNFIINVDNTKLPNDPRALDSESFSPIVRTGGNDRPTFNLPDGRYLVSARSLDHKLWGAYFTLPDDAANDSTLTVRVDLTEVSEVHPLPLGRLTTYVFADNAWTNGAPDGEETAVPCTGDGDNDTCGGNVMAGFRITLDEETDSAVTVDYFNNPLCGDGVCLSDADGFNTIDNLSPATYFIHVTPPDGPCNSNPDSQWYQTTTIDGGLSLWAPVEEGSDGSGAPGEQLWEPIVGVGGAEGNRTGYFFGFVCAPQDFENPGTGEITGTARNWVEWAPYTTGTFNDPVENPFIALTDAATDDTIYVGQGDAAGNFDIQGVPAGTYVISAWDEQLTYIMRFKPITVGPNAIVDANDIGDDGEPGLGVSRWFGWLDGYVYKDLDGDGQYDPCGPDQIPGPTTCDLTLGNTDVDQRWRDGSIKAGTFTDPDGYYVYPTAEGGGLGRWIVGEQGFARFSAFPGASVHDEHTGAVIPSCVTDGPSPAANCIPNSEGGGLLVNQLVLEGHRATVDWGKRDYAPGTPGQIVGITYFATTRNEFNAALQAHEDYEPAIPDVLLYLETPGADGIPNTDDDVVVNEYVTDHWAQPKASQDPLDGTTFTQSCDPIRDFAGNIISNVTGGLFNPIIGPECLEVPLNGIQTKEGKFDGGYAFADYCSGGYDIDNHECNGGVEPDPLVAGDYIVHVIMPKDPTDTRACNTGSRLIASTAKGSIPGDGIGCIYSIVREEDVNVDLGQQYAPQIPPPPCVGDDHVLDQSTLVMRSPYYGDATAHAPLCDKKLIVLQNQQNANADFNMMTNFRTDPNGDGFSSATGDVQEPGRFVGQTFNDIYFETNPESPWYGEPRPIGGIPVGIYARVDVGNSGCPAGASTCISGHEIGRDGDLAPLVTYTPDKWRLIATTTTSPDGSFEVLLPSTETFNCPIPQGPCPGNYMITVDDPGFFDTVPGGVGDHTRPDFNPNLLFATTPASNWPGLTNEFLDLPLDPISGTSCDFSTGPDGIQTTVPELLQVQKRQADNVTLRPASEQGPFVRESDTGADRRITIIGDFIGPAGPTDATGGHVTLTDNATGTVTTLTQANGGIVSWMDSAATLDPADVDTIVIQVPPISGSFTPGPKQLHIIGADSNGGHSTVSGITLHVLSTATSVGARTDTGTTTNQNGRLILDSAIVAGDNGRTVNALLQTGLTGGRTITSVTPGVGFTINSAVTASGTRILTITKVDAGVITNGTTTVTDPLITAADNGRTVFFSGLLLPRTITGVTAGVSFTVSGGTIASATRTATIVKTDAGATISTTSGNIVLDAATIATDVGKAVSGPGIPALTTITAVVPGVRFTMSAAATITASGVTLTIGTTTAVTPYNPTVTIVPPPPPAGGDAHALQNAIDAASPGDLLVLSQGTYNENVLVWQPLKIQGIGPGGIVGAHELQRRAPEDPRFLVTGSVIDGRFFPQNAATYDATVLAHQGSGYALDPTFNTILRGADITVVAQSTSAYGLGTGPTDMLAASTARIDGLALQHGHGDGVGGIQLQAYINNMQLTNNILENNGGVFGGGIGLGQPYAHENNNHKVRMLNDRIFGNGGLTTSGGIGIFFGSDNYEVGGSILCANYSVEYGAGISHWGLSPNSSIHDNKIYFNDSFDSGAGIALQSEVPIGRDCSSTSDVLNCLGQGSGAVDIDRNLFHGNLTGDDGGAIFVANALDQPINIRNNMIVMNLAADLGGGIMLDDASNVSIINNTVANNVTSASSEFSCAGDPACAHGAGLTSEANEPLWQTDSRNTAPYDFSNPVALFNNIFWQNEGMYLDQNGPGATLISLATPPTDGFIDFEIHGTGNSTDTFTPRFSYLTNGLILVPDGSGGFVQNPVPGGAVGPVPNSEGNIGSDGETDPAFVDPSNLTQLGLTVGGSRGDPQQAAVTITAGDPPEGLTGGDFAGNFHLQSNSPAIDRGVRCSNTSATTPTLAACTGGGIQAPLGLPSAANPGGGDYDRENRPQNQTLRIFTPWDLGADEAGTSTSNLSITKTDNQTIVASGSTVTYIIVVTNAGPSGVTDAIVVDNFPAQLTNVTWTCQDVSGSCTDATGTGNINTTIGLFNGGMATFTVSGTVASNATGSLVNTATVAAPAGVIDPTLSNNSATDSDTIVSLPLALRDNFNASGGSSNTLNGNWSQVVTGGFADIRRNASQAFANTAGQAIWNGSGGGGPTYSANQGAAFTFVQNAGSPAAPLANSALILKASGGTAAAPANFIRVLYNGTQVVVATTTNSGGLYTTRGTFSATFATNDTLTAIARADGTVYVYKTNGATTTLLGIATIPGAGFWTGTGRIGMQLPTGARVDNFRGGTVP